MSLSDTNRFGGDDLFDDEGNILPISKQKQQQKKAATNEQQQQQPSKQATQVNAAKKPPVAVVDERQQQRDIQHQEGGGRGARGRGGYRGNFRGNGDSYRGRGGRGRGGYYQQAGEGGAVDGEADQSGERPYRGRGRGGYRGRGGRRGGYQIGAEGGIGGDELKPNQPRDFENKEEGEENETVEAAADTENVDGIAEGVAEANLEGETENAADESAAVEDQNDGMTYDQYQALLKSRAPEEDLHRDIRRAAAEVDDKSFRKAAPLESSKSKLNQKQTLLSQKQQNRAVGDDDESKIQRQTGGGKKSINVFEFIGDIPKQQPRRREFDDNAPRGRGGFRGGDRVFRGGRGGRGGFRGGDREFRGGYRGGRGGARINVNDEQAFPSLS